MKMDLLLTKCILLSFYFLISGTLGALVDPLPQNKTVFTGTKNVRLTCASDRGSVWITWRFASYGNNETRKIAVGKDVYNDAYELDISPEADVSNLIIKTADASVAGVYYCSDAYSEAKAQLTVINGTSHTVNIIIIAVAGFGGFFLIGAIVIFIYRLKKKRISANSLDARTVDQEMQNVDVVQRASNADLVINDPLNDCSSSGSPSINQMQCTESDAPIYGDLAIDINQRSRRPIQMMTEQMIYAPLAGV